MNENLLLENVGKVVNKLRKEKGMSQAKLGELAGTSQMTIQRIELGHPGTRIEALVSVFKVFKVRLVDVFYKIEGEPLDISKKGSKWERLANKVNNLSDKEKNWFSDMVDKMLKKPQ